MSEPISTYEHQRAETMVSPHAHTGMAGCGTPSNVDAVGAVYAQLVMDSIAMAPNAAVTLAEPARDHARPPAPTTERNG